MTERINVGDLTIAFQRSGTARRSFCFTVGSPITASGVGR